MVNSEAVLICWAITADAPIIASIYNEGIRSRAATFETRERTLDDILAWFTPATHPIWSPKVMAKYWVGSRRQPIARANVMRAWPNFPLTVSYNAHEHGIGSALMSAFIPACTDGGFWESLSRIFPENKASLNLCKRYGFREVGIYEKHAQLEGVWRDVVIVERLLSS